MQFSKLNIYEAMVFLLTNNVKKIFKVGDVRPDRKVALCFSQWRISPENTWGIGSLEWLAVALDTLFAQTSTPRVEIESRLDCVCIVLVFAGSMIPPRVERLSDVRFGFVSRFGRFPLVPGNSLFEIRACFGPRFSFVSFPNPSIWLRFSVSFYILDL